MGAVTQSVTAFLVFDISHSVLNNMKGNEMKRKNTFVVIMILMLLFCTILVGCKEDNTVEKDVVTKNIEISTEIDVKSDEDINSVESENHQVETTSANVVRETTKSVQETKSTTGAAKSTKESVEATTAETPTDETTAASGATESSKAPTEQKKPTVADRICYITIDGYCDSKSVEIKSGDSVYDILKKSGASVSARSTGYGVYIEGINGRFEFDEGPTSGWIYIVNGSRPSVSCSNYSVKSGDKIVWTYVEEL